MMPGKTSVRVYLAAPLFSEAETRYNRHLRDLLCQAGYEVYLPQEQGEDARHRTERDDRTIFERHAKALQETEIVVAVCDGPDTDSGTAWEMGYAHALGKSVIAIRTDSRRLDARRQLNLMLEQSAVVVGSTEELIPAVHHVTSGFRPLPG